MLTKKLLSIEVYFSPQFQVSLSAAAIPVFSVGGRGAESLEGRGVSDR
jgi:hypothetical protein